MSKSLHITNKEFVLRDGIAIISRTDAKGNIVDCNDEFIEASGFSHDEVIGKPHNILRHPDMPAEAFRDMWSTLKRGRPWGGMVKNRRKNGDHYWVRATATPLANGAGYVSVRIKPSRQDINAAEALYERMKTDKRIVLDEGRIRSNNPLSRLLSRLENTPKLLLIIQLLLLCVLAGVAGTGFFALNDMKTTARQMVNGNAVLADIYPHLLFAIEAKQTTQDLLHAQDVERQRLLNKLTSLKQNYDAQIRNWETSSIPGEIKASLLGEQRKQADAWWQEALEKFVPAIVGGDRVTAAELGKSMDSYFNAYRLKADNSIALSSKFAEHHFEQLNNTASNNRQALIVIAGLGFLIILMVAMPTTNKIYRSLREMGEAATAIAAGDLSISLPPAGQNEIGNLMVKIAIMRNNLIELVATINQNATAVMHSSGELSTSANSSAEVGSMQSEAASSMAAALEQLSVSISMVGEYTSEARNLALTSSQKSEEGERIIQGAADEMHRIADAVHGTAITIRSLEDFSTQISNIASVIDGIADQTNLLALNAAIEAARAGEQGRGFAVVADEVRKLAERTTASTHEISGMITKIRQGTQQAVQEMEAGVQRVNDGVQLAIVTGNSVTEIRTSNARVTQAVDEINHALKEQVVATNEIAQKVEHIAQGAEGNNQTVIKTAASAQRLEDLSIGLNKLAARFRIA